MCLYFFLRKTSRKVFFIGKKPLEKLIYESHRKNKNKKAENYSYNGQSLENDGYVRNI